MCGSFALLAPLKKLLQRFQIEDSIINESEYTPSEKILPTEEVPVVTADYAGNGEKFTRKLVGQKWGFLPDYTSRPLINARGETVDEKPTFSSAFLNHRCLIPASSFYEWKEIKTGRSRKKYTISLKERELISFAGIYSSFREGKKGGNCFVIITRPALSSLQPIHDRMPVILNKYQEYVWLKKSSSPEELKKMLFESTDQQLSIQPPPEKDEQLKLF